MPMKAVRTMTMSVMLPYRSHGRVSIPNYVKVTVCRMQYVVYDIPYTQYDILYGTALRCS